MSGKNFSCKRGDVFYADLDPIKGSEQHGRWPVLVVQNNRANEKSPVTIVLICTTQFEPEQATWPCNLLLPAGTGGLDKSTLVLGNQVRTLSVDHRFVQKLGHVERALMEKINDIIADTTGVNSCPVCGYPNHRDRIECSHCHTGLRIRCSACRAVLELTWHHCPHCGKKRGGSGGR